MRLAGHALTHLAWHPGAGWAWACQCGYTGFGYEGTQAIARSEHRDHKQRIGTPAEHGTLQSSGRVARCICGHHIAGRAGGMPSWDEIAQRWEQHRLDHEPEGSDHARG